MPPEEEPRPPANERSAILSHLRTLLSKTTANAKPKQVTLRRLNRVQYRNTIRDLLLLDLTVDDPTEAFPADDKLEGFDNLGEALQMSDFLLRQYLKVARRLVDRSTFAGDKPEPVTYTLRQEGKNRPKNFSMGRDDPTRSYAVLTRNDERAPGDPRGQSLTNCRDGATHDGYYDFTFEVESQGRGNLTKAFGAQRRNDYPVYRPKTSIALRFTPRPPANLPPANPSAHSGSRHRLAGRRAGGHQKTDLAPQGMEGRGRLWQRLLGSGRPHPSG